MATQPTLDPRLTGRGRQIWVRRVVGLVAVAVVLVVGTDLAFGGLDDSYRNLWPSSTPQLVVGIGLVVVGLVLMIAGAARSVAKDLDRSFIGLDAYLPRRGRAWARHQIAAGRAVVPERRDVVTVIAQQMRSEGNQVLVYSGLCCSYAGTLVDGPSLSNLVVFGVLIAWLGVLSVRALVWSARARRWLALHP
ncbi:hypothetical protein SAMN04488544_3765 [Microlunatus sagamiharensis]|uniref:Uncharacterized protein n=1 Tax=Microlunatus sagamiharensis TaxID=546874 RepID=A0A1H2NEK0_9ACTN|nr:hypothetical protein [Microlunatus sagamiharensis]SDV03236.1 hypothetical protein SAMN04488544_3765 [Microlunatus sagamiharensis]